MKKAVARVVREVESSVNLNECETNIISTINDWTKVSIKEVEVLDNLASFESYVADTEKLGMWWYISNIKTSKRSTYKTIWFDCSITGQMVATSFEQKAKWLKAIMEELSLANEILLQDGSPIFINQCELTNNVSETKLTVSCTYGIVRKEVPAELLMNTNFNLEKGEKQ